MSVIETRTKFVFVVAKFVFRLEFCNVNDALGWWLCTISTFKLSVVIVPKVLVNVITESNESSLCVTEPLKSTPNDKLPLPFITIAGFDDVNVPLWFEL